MTYAKIIADSISPGGVRLTTMEVRFHRFVLAEFNTHRVFSRNSASSRAIPVQKQIDRILMDLARPVSWPAEQKGMQGGEELPEADREVAETVWAIASRSAIETAQRLTRRGLHKSVTNRPLEPFMWHTVVVTATAWENFFDLRLDPDAQPEIRVAAEAMKKAYDESTPTPLGDGDWHLPYITDEDRAQVGYKTADEKYQANAIGALVAVSAARCARTSYLTQDGKQDMDEDLRLYDRLVTDRVEASKGVHWSPLEHVATPWPQNRQEGALYFPHLPYREEPEYAVPLDHLPRVGNLLGWRSLRTEVEAINNQRTYR